MHYPFLRFVLALVICLVAGVARANTYEWQRTEQLLRREGLMLAERPEGKRIAFIRVVRDDVFVKDEIWPTFLSRWFHVKSRDEMVRRELLFAEGGPYRDARIEETMRNLRNMSIFALVRIVPVSVPGDPDAVGVLVHTRDIWSLRLETSFSVTTQIDDLLVRLTETNLLGRNKQVAVDMSMIPKSYTLRELYAARRVWGSSISLSESVGIVMNRERNQPEGSTWAFRLSHPYYNLAQKWAWVTSANYDTIIARRLRQGEVRPWPEPRDDPDGPYARRAWRQRVASGSAVGYLRLGHAYKQTWGLGFSYSTVAANPIEETMLPPEIAAEFRRRVLPRERKQLGPTFSYSIGMPTFKRFENLGTFGQTENVQIGPRASLGSTVPLKAFGSDGDSWVFTSSVGATYAPGGFLLEGSLGGRLRYETRGIVDQRMDVLLRGATPVLFRTFRFVARGVLEARKNDTANTYVTLGANNGLRGYTSQAIAGVGQSRVLGNFEVRTLPLEWQAVHVGLVAFYDVGSVFGNVRDLHMNHAVGLGLRVLFPQFNRYPFSFDGGTSYDPGFRFVPTITSGQVVPLTALEDPD